MANLFGKKDEVEKEPEGTKAAEAPVLTREEKRTNAIESNIGSLTGWTYVERIALAEIGICDATGGRLKNGVKLEGNGKTIIVGEGTAEKYLDAAIPSKREERAERLAKERALKEAAAPKKAPKKVREIAPEAANQLDELTNKLG